MGPLYAHLGRDPYPSSQLLLRVAPNVCQWIQRMNSPESKNTGSFLFGDQVPETLIPILARM